MADHLDEDAIPIVRIPADVDQPDKIVAGLTARQLAVLGTTTLLLWLGYQACRQVVPPIPYLLASAPVLLGTAVAVTMKRDGVPLDRLLGAWVRYRRTPPRQVLAPEGLPQVPKRLAKSSCTGPAPFISPVREVAETGVLDLGSDGVSALARCSTVNLSLRSPREQSVLLAGFARWLNSLTGQTAITVRSRPADLSGVCDSLLNQAASLQNEALSAAASEHANFIAHLVADEQLLTREVIVAVHESSKAAASRLHRRLEDADSLLGCADIAVDPLPEHAATDLINDAYNPAPAGLRDMAWEEVL
ncbi:PrgI family protein [Catenulispora rubra]|uniref:PrgI family protein n=1 Tax=Catenulispora rubra TaxID=280293 RepID=UPI001892834A|nr:PrgI family protein [Catenulispora rubra]